VLNDLRAVPTFIRVLLEDPNPGRRSAAARALGWIHPSNRTTALALAQCLTDSTQPQFAREVAAESLAYVGTRATIDALVSALYDPDARIRFWAVFGLGGSCRGDARAVRALESVLDDSETPPGNWWPVGKEALAMLAGLPLISNPYRDKLKAATQGILADPAAGAEDRRWAECYDDSILVESINAGARS
jgi:HEAT repeat protein